MQIQAKTPSIIQKFGKVLVESGVIDTGTQIIQNARPEFVTALKREYASLSKGDEIAKTYRAYANLAKNPEYIDDVKSMLKQLAESFGLVDEKKVAEFIDNALNHTESFIAEASKTVETMSPEQMQTMITNAKEQAEIRRAEAQSLATAPSKSLAQVA